MKKTLINQALKNAVGQESCGNTSVQAEKTDPAALSAREFEDFLASIVTGVIQNVVDVRAGKLNPTRHRAVMMPLCARLRRF